LLLHFYRRVKSSNDPQSGGEQMKLWKMVVIGAAAALTLGVGANLVAASGADDPVGVVDISGPCDEAEHANDPECAGATAPGTQQGADDNRDEDGRDHDGRNDDDRDDNSGPSENSGPGNSGDDDNSGPGSGDDDSDDDNSGPGSGDDDSDDDN
jgi:hypothetical protein